MVKGIFCISGKAESGKDTTANYIKQLLEQEGHKVCIIHFADLLKYICKTYFDWDGKKDDIGRTLLQRVGTEIVRERDPAFWVSFVSKFISVFRDEWDYIAIPDCRFPNEVDKNMYGEFPILHIRLNRPNHISALTEEQKQHASETALDNILPDILIVNDGTLEDLYIKICKILNAAEICQQGDN